MQYKFRVNYDQFKAGEIVYEFTGHTYGILRDDEDMLGVSCTAVTREIGKNPFAVVPTHVLEAVN